MLWVFLFGFLLSLPLSSAAVIISEVHPDPISDESLNEWVELYNDGSEPVDVTNWTFGDAADNDTIEGPFFGGEGAIIPASGFAILTDEETRVYENYNVSDGATHLYITDAALGNGLLNDGELIFLFFNGTLVSQVNYSRPTPGFSSSLINGTFQKASPTPGTFNNGSSFAGCDYEVHLILNSSTFTNPNDFGWKLIARNLKGGSTNFTARAAIHDLFGNVEQEYSPFTNQSITTQRTSSTFSPNLAEGKSYLLSANLSTQCQDSNEANNRDERIFTIQGKLTAGSSLKILSILDKGSDGAAAFGQAIRVRINSYRGATTKESIAVWIEDNGGKKLSKQSRVTIDEQYSNATFTIPIQIVPNCDGEFDDDTYTLKMEGLDAEDEMDIDVEGMTDSLCQELPGAKKAASSRGKVSFEVVELPAYFHNDPSTALLRIANTYNEEKKVELWSYIYRGSVAFSGNREANRRLLTLPASSSIEAELSNTPSVKEGGEYKIKFLLQEQGLKTPKELPFDILVSKYEDEQVTSTSAASPGASEREEALIASRASAQAAISIPETVFSSSARKAQDLAPLLLIAALTGLVVALVWRR